MVLVSFARVAGANIARQFAPLKPSCRAFATWYTKSHEWLRVDQPAEGVLGITDYAQNELGEVVFVDLPDVGKELKKGQTALSVESVKAVGEVYAPVDGKILEVNSELTKNPGLVNDEPEGKGWMLKLAIRGEPKGMMTKEEYDNFIKKEGKH